MSTVRVSSSIGDLRDDLLRISKEAPIKLRGVVADGIKAGNQLAKDNARRTSGSHGKWYPGTFSTEMHSTYGHSFSGGGNVYSGEYGPVMGRRQGGMSFEWGSRKQPPHLDLNKSADVIGPQFPREVGDVVDRLFW